MGVGRGDLATPWILKISSKKVIFLISSGKKQITLLLSPLEKFWKNPLVPPLEKILPTPVIQNMFVYIRFFIPNEYILLDVRCF